MHKSLPNMTTCVLGQCTSPCLTRTHVSLYNASRKFLHIYAYPDFSRGADRRETEKLALAACCVQSCPQPAAARFTSGGASFTWGGARGSLNLSLAPASHLLCPFFDTWIFLCVLPTWKFNKCIFPNCKMYLSKLTDICMYANCKMYLSKVQNVFVQITNKKSIQIFWFKAYPTKFF